MQSAWTAIGKGFFFSGKESRRWLDAFSPPNSPDLEIFEDGISEGIYLHELLDSLVDASDELGPNVDEPDPIWLPEHHREVGHRLGHREARLGELKLGLEVFHGG